MFDARDLERIVYAIADANEIETASFLLVRNVGAHQRPYACGIHIGNVGEVDDEGTRTAGAHFGLKVEQRRDEERPAETQDALSVFRARQILNNQGLLWHGAMLVRVWQIDC